MKTIKRMLAAGLIAALLLAMLTGCGAGGVLIGSWVDKSGQLQIEFAKNGTCTVTAYGFALPATYKYAGDSLTIWYSEEHFEEGTLTLYGDDEFVWEKPDAETGEVFHDWYTRQ